MILETIIERIPSTRRANQLLLGRYLVLLANQPLPPPPPNPNVVSLRLAALFDHVRYQREEYPRLSNKWAKYAALLFPPTTTVPNLIGRQLSDALTLLANATLTGAFVELPADPSIPYHQVTTQDTPAGTPLGQGTVINFTVQSLTNIPNVIGEGIGNAQLDIIAAFLIFQTFFEVSSQPPGRVIRQSPLSGAVPAGTQVTLFAAEAGDGFRVKAVTAGLYAGQYYQPGDVFDLIVSSDYSDSTLNYESGGGEYSPGWMIQVPANTPLTQDDGNASFPAVDPNRRFVE